ncbi:hypothetical protein CSQ92_11890 [Janthinobacterium sp. BJB446]|nr:hypothetical protein CSQ92_11890 [Janthinobacterium sp. BJB446]
MVAIRGLGICVVHGGWESRILPDGLDAGRQAGKGMPAMVAQDSMYKMLTCMCIFLRQKN